MGNIHTKTISFESLEGTYNILDYNQCQRQLRNDAHTQKLQETWFALCSILVVFTSDYIVSHGFAIFAENSPHKGQWRDALVFSLICTWTNDWVNNRDAGDTRRHRAHYDVTVMFLLSQQAILYVSHRCAISLAPRIQSDSGNILALLGQIQQRICDSKNIIYCR